MATKASKIPVYIKSKIPVASTKYKSVLKKIKETKIELENKEAEIKTLLKDFERLKFTEPSEEIGEVDDVEDTKEEDIDLADRSAGAMRKVICTPGGTKRKVKLSHVKFKFDLGKALEQIVEKKIGGYLKADELIEELRGRFPASYIDRKAVLRTASQLFDKNLERRGKKKEGFYVDLALRKQEEEIESDVKEAFASPSCKMTKKDQIPYSEDAENKSKVSCKGRLQFSETTLGSAVESTAHLHIDSIEQVNDIALENELLKEKIKKLEETLSQQQDVSSKLVTIQSEVIELYKLILENGSGLGGILSLSERNQINIEISKAKNIFNLGVRGKEEVVDFEQIINPILFNNLLRKIKEECPTIANLLEQLVLSRNTFRNIKKTDFMKMKAGIHLLSSLLDVRDQNAKNDIQLLFGLLCISYGARSSMIEILQHLGLSESFPVLCNVLRKQLQNYKTLIQYRVPMETPVVTYQDNIQMQRTSLRHLRMSKLQKDKHKQNKMWDFTVRGWRVADVTGIEELFKDRSTAKEPQGDVSKLKFEDTNIESHKVHNGYWLYFKERNLLRKMDLAFNQVRCSSHDIQVATSDEIRKIAESEPNENKKVIMIDIPPVPEEFKNSSDKTRIYPLPISIENQCTTLGLASTLNTFKEEFDFVNEESSKFLPLKKNKREFNLNLAYERYAFLKAMEVHKKEKEEYEQFLRKSLEPVSFDE